MPLSDWKKKKEEATNFKPRPNILARVVGFDNDKVLLDVINTNHFYDGPPNLALDILDKNGNLTASTMSNPDLQTFKNPDPETGGIISVPALAIRSDLGPIERGNIEYHAAEAPCVFGVVNDTARQGRLTVFNAIWHKELQESKDVMISGEQVNLAPQIRTFTSIPDQSVEIKNLSDLEFQIINNCKSTPLPGRNTCGLTLRAFDSSNNEVINHAFLPPSLLHDGEKYRRPLEGEAALEHFKGQKFYRDFIIPFMSALEAGELQGTRIETFPTVRSNAGEEEVKHSEFFNDDGSLNERGRKVQAKFLSEDGAHKLVERGVMVFRKTEQGTMRPHIGVPYLSGFQRYGGTLEQAPSALYSGDGKIPMSLYQAKYSIDRSVHQEAAKTQTTGEDVEFLEDLEQEMPDELHSTPARDPEADFTPPADNPPASGHSSELESTASKTGQQEAVADFEPDFSDSFSADFTDEMEEELSPGGMSR